MARRSVEAGEEADAAVAVVEGRVVQTEGEVVHVRVLSAMRIPAADGQAASVKRSPRADRCDGRGPEWCD
ncbi:hypothetical protein GCM10010365_23080 [Streptomyces poonensis]|uniref:Uncharacterized protein n=1 Tax=Streptomyces poonensis TaxID=68255 RepID=A0A918PEE4_9ACTN|nr:hypothetical protein GCM10010365_23080 [Streptomyces poonensis]GLJ90747.1 hypothetical protein GCM10017589_33520 [Streptomyces poonensis]